MADSPRRRGGSSDSRDKRSGNDRDNSRNNSRGTPPSAQPSGGRSGGQSGGRSGGPARGGAGQVGGPKRAERSGESNRSGRPDREKSAGRAGSPDRGGSSGRAGAPRSGGRPPGADNRRQAPGRERPGERPGERAGERPRRDEDLTPPPVFPSIDEDVEPKQLDRIARRDLTPLDKDDAEFVAKHLVMAGRLIDDDIDAAHQHALAAFHKGSRIPVVRETLGISAYLSGDFALALRELRTHRRLTGKDVNVPMMVDCERGLERPQRGIELARSVQVDSLEAGVKVELAIALSGARLDLGQPERALLELQIPELNPDLAFSYSPALFDAYAVVLDELGRSAEAATWGERAHVAARALAQAQGPADDIVVVDLDTEDDPGAAQESDSGLEAPGSDGPDSAEHQGADSSNSPTATPHDDTGSRGEQTGQSA